MPDDLMGTLVAALLTALTTYVALRTKILRDLEAKYDADLRERRMNAYAALWALTEPLALYSPPRDLSGHGARALSERLRHWYFTDGIVLTEDTGNAYFAFQKALTTDSLAAAASDTAPLDPTVLERLREASSKLRHAMSHDLASRRPPLISNVERKE